MNKFIIKHMSPSVYYFIHKHDKIGGWYITHSKAYMKDRAASRKFKENYLFIQLMDHLNEEIL